MGTNAQQFCLKWNNHQANMLSVFDRLLSNKSLVDVTIGCEGRQVKAHKVVLSACSPFFENLFTENPCKHPIVILKDIRYADLTALVEFMYKGEVNVIQEQLPTLLKTAEALKIKGLAEVTGDSGKSDDKPHASVTPRPESPGSRRKRQRVRRKSTDSAAGGGGHSDSEESMPKASRTEHDDSSMDGATSLDDGSQASLQHQQTPSKQTSAQDALKDPSIVQSNNAVTVNNSPSSAPAHNNATNSTSNGPNSSSKDADFEPTRLLEASMTTDHGADNSTDLTNSTGPDNNSIVHDGLDIKPIITLEEGATPAGAIVPATTPSLPTGADAISSLFPQGTGATALPGTSYQASPQSHVAVSQPTAAVRLVSGSAPRLAIPLQRLRPYPKEPLAPPRMVNPFERVEVCKQVGATATPAASTTALQPSKGQPSEGEAHLNPILTGLLEHGSTTLKTALPNLVSVQRRASPPSTAVSTPSSAINVAGVQPATSAAGGVTSTLTAAARPQASPYIIRPTTRPRPPKQISVPSVSQLEKVITDSIQRGVDVSPRNFPTFTASSSKNAAADASPPGSQDHQNVTADAGGAASTVDCLAGSLSNQVTSLVRSLPDETTSLVKAPPVAVKLKISKSEGNYESKVIEVMKKSEAMEQLARDMEVAKKRLPPTSAAVLVLPQQLQLGPPMERPQQNTIVISGHVVTGDQSGNLLRSASCSHVLEPLHVEQDFVGDTSQTEEERYAGEVCDGQTQMQESSNLRLPVAAVSDALNAINVHDYAGQAQQDIAIQGSSLPDPMQHTTQHYSVQDTSSQETMQSAEQQNLIREAAMPQESISEVDQDRSQESRKDDASNFFATDVAPATETTQTMQTVCQEPAPDSPAVINVEAPKSPETFSISDGPYDESTADDQIIDDVEEPPPNECDSIDEEELAPHTVEPPPCEEVVIDLTENDVNCHMVLNIPPQKEEFLTRRRPSNTGARPIVPKVGPLCRSSLKPNIAGMRRNLKPLLPKDNSARPMPTQGQSDPGPIAVVSDANQPVNETVRQTVLRGDNETSADVTTITNKTSLLSSTTEKCTSVATEVLPTPEISKSQMDDGNLQQFILETDSTGANSSPSKRKREASQSSEASSEPSHSHTLGTEAGQAQRRSSRPKVPTPKIVSLQREQTSSLQRQDSAFKQEAAKSKPGRPSRRTLVPTRIVLARKTVPVTASGTGVITTTTTTPPPKSVTIDTTRSSDLASQSATASSTQIDKTDSSETKAAASQKPRTALKVVPRIIAKVAQGAVTESAPTTRINTCDAVTNFGPTDERIADVAELRDTPTTSTLGSSVSENATANQQSEATAVTPSTATNLQETKKSVTPTKDESADRASSHSVSEDDKEVPSLEVIGGSSAMILEKNLRCPLCPYKTHTQRFLDLHKRSHKCNVSCATCHKVFPDQQAVKDHEELEHAEDKKVTRNDGKSIQCPHCEYKTKFQVYMIRHITLRHGD